MPWKTIALMNINLGNGPKKRKKKKQSQKLNKKNLQKEPKTVDQDQFKQDTIGVLF